MKMLSLMETVLGRQTATTRRPSVVTRMSTAWALHRSRARLAELDPHLLADIGLDEETARTEARRSVWDAPDAWKC
jgi:uncharacterized protein YjiS (DUF1127 family)